MNNTINIPYILITAEILYFMLSSVSSSEFDEAFVIWFGANIISLMVYGVLLIIGGFAR